MPGSSHADETPYEISRSEGELNKDKLHETMAHPIQLGEAPEPGAA